MPKDCSCEIRGEQSPCEPLRPLVTLFPHCCAQDSGWAKSEGPFPGVYVRLCMYNILHRLVGQQLVALFWNVVEPLKGQLYLKEVGHRGISPVVHRLHFIALPVPWFSQRKASNLL